MPQAKSAGSITLWLSRELSSTNQFHDLSHEEYHAEVSIHSWPFDRTGYSKRNTQLVLRRYKDSTGRLVGRRLLVLTYDFAADFSPPSPNSSVNTRTDHGMCKHWHRQAARPRTGPISRSEEVRSERFAYRTGRIVLPDATCRYDHTSAFAVTAPAEGVVCGRDLTLCPLPLQITICSTEKLLLPEKL